MWLRDLPGIGCLILLFYMALTMVLWFHLVCEWTDHALLAYLMEVVNSDTHL